MIIVEKIKPLPLPNLEHLSNDLKDWIKPHVSELEYNHTVQSIDYFFQQTNQAAILQKKLEAFNKKYPKNWLTPLWNDLYLKYRNKLHTGTNYSMVFHKDYYPHIKTIENLTGKTIHILAEFYKIIMNNELAQKKLVEPNICLKQYFNIFKGIRIPQVEIDQYKVAKNKKNQFIIIVMNNHFYKLNITDNNGNTYNIKTLTQAIKNTLNELTKSNENTLNIGLLTTAKRDEAASIYNELIVNKQNKRFFKWIEKALFLLHFDLESTNSKLALERLFLNADDKYFDKTLQVVITQDLHIGLNVEHTGVDGATILTLIDYLTHHLKNNHPNDEKIKELHLDALNFSRSALIEKKLNKLYKLNKFDQKNYHVDYLMIDFLGKSKIKSLGFSPDAFFQIALQIAQYKTFGVMKSTYEPVSMKIYDEGRTECARPSTQSHLNLARAWNKNENDDALFELLQSAANEHVKRIKQCINGNGVERHMYGLESMYLKHKNELNFNKPEIFSSLGYKTLKNDFLSTTNVSHPSIKHFIFGPTSENGFGIFYSLLNNEIIINISSRTKNNPQAKRLLNHLEKTLLELMQFIQKIKKLPY